MGFRLNLRSGFSLQFAYSTNSRLWPSSNSFRGWEVSSSRVSCSSTLSRDNETICSNLFIAHTSSGSQTLDIDYTETERRKMNVGKRSCSCSYNMADDLDVHTLVEEHDLAFLASLQATKMSHVSLLIENLDVLEKTFSDSDVVRLERDILVQLEKLGALKLFYDFLSKMLKRPTLLDLSDAPIELIEKPHINDPVNDHINKILVHSGKKKEREFRRQRALQKSKGIHGLPLPSKTISKEPQKRNFLKKSVRGRLGIARDEANMSRGVKLVAELEKIRMVLEEATGQVASLSNWAEAAGVEKKLLQKHLHYGWHCRHRLLKSTRTLVVFLARNYRGLGVAFDDLIQAGNIGVLQGAERFDDSKGCQFSTYVQYWIRRSMSALVAQHARGIRIPVTLNKAINQIQKARKAMNNSHGKHPEDSEIAKFTGLSIAKIVSASKCLRVVGSVDQKLGDSTSARFLELIPDTSIESPEETVMKQHMVKDINSLLKRLDPRERQVLVLRFGLRDHQRKSLEEIGKVFGVSKEWIRKIERRALTKLRDEGNLQNLSHYLYNCNTGFQS